MGLKQNDLIDRSALSFANKFGQLYGRAREICIFAGPDMNGAIALAIARLLKERQYKVQTYLFYQRGSLSELCEAQRTLAMESGLVLEEVSRSFTQPTLSAETIILDGLFGIELLYPLEGGFEKLALWINSLNNEVVSLDLPSGMFADVNHLNQKSVCIRAKCTISFETPKLVMFLSEYQSYLGAWHIVPLGISTQVHNLIKTEYHCSNEDLLENILRCTDRLSSLRERSQVLIWGGSKGCFGQLALASRAALLSGCSSVHLSTEEIGHLTLSLLIPEAKLLNLRLQQSSVLTNLRAYNAIALGIHSGRDNLKSDELRNLLSAYRGAIVLEGEVLRLLAEQASLLDMLPEHSVALLNPETMQALFKQQYTDFSFLEEARTFATKYKLNLVLRGTYTTVIRSTGAVYFSRFGGMAVYKEGVNELLSTLIAGLIARGYDSIQATLLGVYLWGTASDIYTGRYTAETLSASVLLDELPAVLRELYQ